MQNFKYLIKRIKFSFYKKGEKKPKRLKRHKMISK